MEVARVTKKHHVGLRASICSRIDKRAEQNVRNRNEVVNSIPLTDKWTNKIYESGVGAVSEDFHRTQIERLARVVGISSVRNK